MNRKKNSMMLILSIVSAFSSIAFAMPNLTPGVWTDITPPWLTKGSNNTMIAQGITIDPNNPSTIFWCNTPFTTSQGGLFKSTDGGSTWKRIGHITNPKWNNVDTLDEPLCVRINPKNSLQMYCGDGVRGSTPGIFVSTDGGENWTEPANDINWVQDSGTDDVYDVAVDPTDFNHVLISFHSGWKVDGGGVLESTDRGVNWHTHPLGGAGNSIAFLYEPRLGIGNSNTWLLGMQGGGYWRTSNGGVSWTKVNDNGIFHGGGKHYYSKTGVLYASAGAGFLRSTNNGLTWTNVAPFNDGTTCVYGDGNLLYTAPTLGNNTPWYTSPETDGITWTPMNSQTFHFGGPYEMALDTIRGIMYSSNWEQGCMALKIANFTTQTEKSIASSEKAGIRMAQNQAFIAANGALTSAHGNSLNGKPVDFYSVRGELLRRTSTGNSIVQNIGDDNFGRQAIVVRSR